MKAPRVLIADDHTLLAEGIASILSKEYEVVGISADGHQLLADAERLRPDLITLDIGLPVLNGLEAARRVLKVLPRVKIVFVTQHAEGMYLRAALNAGGIGFVAKQTASGELLTALRSALLNRRYITPLLPDVFHTVPGMSAGLCGKTGDTLTSRQREVLQLVVEGHTSRAISERLNISPKTVEFHKGCLMTSLGVRNVVDLVRYALANKLVAM